MIFQNKSFYPTPARLISRMIAKIKGHALEILAKPTK